MPVIGFFAWLVGLVSTAFTSFATLLIGRMVYEKAIHYALVTAFLVAAAGLTATLSLTIKTAIMAAQVNMPPLLANATYFLPANINTILACIVTLRVSSAIYRWTVKTMSAYLPSDPRHGLML